MWAISIQEWEAQPFAKASSPFLPNNSLFSVAFAERGFEWGIHVMDFQCLIVNIYLLKASS